MLLANVNLSKLDQPIMTMGAVAKAAMRVRLARTVALMRRMHGNQKDKAGVTYWHHPYRVMKRLEEVPGMTESVLHAALLHDIVEDTPMTLDDLWQLGYPFKTLTIIDEVTRYERRADRGETYEQWIFWMAHYARQASRLVKIADIADNMAPFRRASLPKEFQGLDRRYQTALDIFCMRMPQELLQTIRFGDFIGPHWLEPAPPEAMDGEFYMGEQENA